MAARRKRVPPAEREDLDAAAVLARYGRWLKRQPLAERSRDAYLAQVGGFVTWLAGSEHGAQALTDPHVRTGRSGTTNALPRPRSGGDRHR